jgi:GMP synthase (glutamine-hydrolysing)
LKPVLVVDYSVDGLSGETIAGRLEHTCEVVAVRAGGPFPRLDTDSFSGVVHSGSALSITHGETFTGDACRMVAGCVRSRIPQLGICYGHQLLCLAILGRDAVERAAEGPEIGWLDVELVSGAVPGTLPRECVWQSHYDRVNRVPPGAAVIARNDHTEIQAFHDPVRRLLGTQFHPEFDRVSGNRQYGCDADLFRKHGIDMEQVLESAPDRDAGALFMGYFLRMVRGEA